MKVMRAAVVAVMCVFVFVCDAPFARAAERAFSATLTTVHPNNMPSWFIVAFTGISGDNGGCSAGVVALAAEANKAQYALAIAALLSQKAVTVYWSGPVRTDGLCQITGMALNR